MKTFLLATILATAFTCIVGVEWPGTSMAQSCITLDCRCGGC